MALCKDLRNIYTSIPIHLTLWSTAFAEKVVVPNMYNGNCKNAAYVAHNQLLTV